MKITILNPLRLLCLSRWHPFPKRDPEDRCLDKSARLRCRVCGRFVSKEGK